MAEEVGSPERIVVYDGTKGAQFPFGWSELFGCRPPWGRQDPLVYVIPGVVAVLLLVLCGFTVPPLVMRFGWWVGVVATVLVCAVPVYVGWRVAKKRWQSRLIPRLLIGWMLGRQASRAVRPGSELEPPYLVVATAVYLPLMEEVGGEGGTA